MPTTLPRPRVGAEIRVRPDLTRTFLDPDRPAEPDPHAGEHGVVVGYNAPAPSLDRATGEIGGTTWDLQVVFLGGRGSVYDMDEVEILYDGPWTKTATVVLDELLRHATMRCDCGTTTTVTIDPKALEDAIRAAAGRHAQRNYRPGVF